MRGKDIASYWYGLTENMRLLCLCFATVMPLHGSVRRNLIRSNVVDENGIEVDSEVDSRISSKTDPKT